MTVANTSIERRRFGKTARRDTWWLQPLAVFVGLSAFIVYSTWAAFQGEHYTAGPYLSPFYSPELFGDSGHSWFGPKPGWWPGWMPWSPALLILWAPGGFRLSCYYYRGAYYKAFWADPPSCAVGEPRSSYRGEHSFPLIIQNIHRYFLSLAMMFILILADDAWLRSVSRNNDLVAGPPAAIANSWPHKRSCTLPHRTDGIQSIFALWYSDACQEMVVVLNGARACRKS